MTYDEIKGMTLSELTLEQFVVVAFTLLVCAALAVFIFIIFLQVISLLFDLVCYLVCKDKRHGGWWFKRNVCYYLKLLKNQTVKVKGEKAYYLYYNRLIGAANALLELGLITSELWLKFTKVPSYEKLHPEYKKEV